MRRVSRTVLAAAVFSAVALSGCAAPGSDAGGGGNDGSGQPAIGGTGPDDATSNESGQQPSPGTTPAPAGDALPALLTITVDDGGGNVMTYTLSCEPVGGDHPDPAGACAGLAAAGAAAFSPPNPNQACTEIYGGPQTAAVTGTLAGKQLNSTFSRGNGCEIARWDALAAVFANAGGA